MQLEREIKLRKILNTPIQDRNPESGDRVKILSSSAGHVPQIKGMIGKEYVIDSIEHPFYRIKGYSFVDDEIELLTNHKGE